MPFSNYPHEFAVRATTVLGSHLEASITMREHGLAIRAGSNTRASGRCDQVEAITGVGPCIDAMDELRAQIVPTIAVETRWTRWKEQALKEGFVSAVAVPAVVEPEVSAALNLYARSADPWTPQLLAAADSYAQLIASAIRLRLEVAALEDAATGLYSAMSDTTVAERAIGAIMRTNQCHEEEARKVLNSASHRRNVEVREVAETVLRALVFEGRDETGA
ncbi:ANTAR domain-containing protein [Myceligenerans pegani]|uniref:ANTAR domain-containing protein n=1 Tax=Myceligenerans pegani TaxID=2776917 RepID=A0ABR9MV67_9MICO|nr:ANTAR domain-containing protein [Myceligenerans sp. TRM 65318]MBE1875282.1 ANTAR domain-containing protein [Myceligenerans sp. TRM 65318]MBE3017553.1 ANTAR domain-containing protein [Myceligenerans sp. TRM 65318]